MSGDPGFGTEAEWEAARAAARADVQAALARPPRPCPNCGRPQPGAAWRCADCGADLVAPHRRSRPGLRGGLIATVVLAAVAAFVLVVVPPMRDNADAERRAEALRQERLEAAERARLIKDVQPIAIQGPRRRRGEDALDHRSRLVAAGADAITADARGRVTLDVRGTSCAPYPETQTRRDLEADASVPAGRYECVAFERRFPLSELQGKARTGILGTPYWLVIDYRTAGMTFCKITPRAGEGGRSLAFVPVPEACRDPLRKR